LYNFVALNADPLIDLLPTRASTARPRDGKKGNCREGQDVAV
jgi:hypothetical protein